MKKVKLQFMVYKLEDVAYVPNPVLVKIVKPDNIFITGILGKSGIKLMERGVCFLFEKSLALELIKMRVAKKVKEEK